jgi:predicted phosphodiesterase
MVANNVRPTQEELQEVVDAHHQFGQTNAKAARSLDMPVSTFRHRLKMAEDDGLYPRTDGADQVATEHYQVLRKRDDEIRSLKAQLAATHRDNINADTVRSIITNLGETLPDPPKWVVDQTPEKNVQSGIPITLWSDWHVGEVIDIDQMGGRNQYDIAIAQRRVRTLVEKIIDLCFNHTVNPTYPGIVVMLGGDMISGLIHEELVELSDGTFMNQIHECYALLVWGIETLADAFGRIHLPCVVGNHGRLRKQVRAKGRVVDSFEHMIYCFLERHFANDTRVTFQVSMQTDVLFEVAGHRNLLTHGDSTGARGGDGQIGSFGPILRGEKKVREVAAWTDDTYDTIWMGHYHQFFANDRIIVNPSLSGYDEYAKDMLRASPERPAQVLAFIHPKYGIIDIRRIYLEAKPTSKKKAAFVALPEDTA